MATHTIPMQAIFHPVRTAGADERQRRLAGLALVLALFSLGAQVLAFGPGRAPSRPRSEAAPAPAPALEALAASEAAPPLPREWVWRKDAVSFDSMFRERRRE